MKKTDCFGYSKELNRCIVLDKTYCKTQECGFYKKRGTLCKGCPSKGKEKTRYSECATCADARKGM